MHWQCWCNAYNEDVAVFSHAMYTLGTQRAISNDDQWDTSIDQHVDALVAISCPQTALREEDPLDPYPVRFLFSPQVEWAKEQEETWVETVIELELAVLELAVVMMEMEMETETDWEDDRIRESIQHQ